MLFRSCAQAPSGADTLHFYASQPGRPTLDEGDGGGNPFASALVELLNAPALDLAQLQSGIVDVTRTKSRGFQRPDIKPAVTKANWTLLPRTAGESRVAIFNLNQNLNAWVTQPPASLTNVTTPACPSTGNSGGIPTYSVKDCTAAGLSAQAVGAQSPNWWESYLFSDDFHPTPRGHQLAADALIRDVLRDRGWN